MSFFLIFPGVKCFFPVENSYFGRPKTNFSGFEKWKARKKSSPHFVTFSPSIFNFSPSPFRFSSFSAPFSLFFLASIFPVGQLKFPGQKSLVGTMPPACYTPLCVWLCVVCVCVRLSKMTNSATKSSIVNFPNQQVQHTFPTYIQFQRFASPGNKHSYHMSYFLKRSLAMKHSDNTMTHLLNSNS